MNLGRRNGVAKHLSISHDFHQDRHVLARRDAKFMYQILKEHNIILGFMSTFCSRFRPRAQRDPGGERNPIAYRD
jgi:hypothetical protein